MLFTVENQSAIYNERMAIVLGLVTLGFAVAAFVSCRTFVSMIGYLGIKNLGKSWAYERFNRYHFYYWWLFGVSMLAHLMMGTFHTGLPQAGDPDGGSHWAILILGTVGALSGIALFTSCRISPRLLSPQIPRLSLANKAYKSFFKYHSYYWIIFGISVTAHFAVSYLHAGIWPLPG